MNPFTSHQEIPTAHSRTFQLARIALSQFLSERDLEGPAATVEATVRRSYRQSGVALEIYFEAGAIKTEAVAKETIQVPADWWSSFKLRWFPKWALVRWPSEMRTINKVVNTTRICPHVGFDARPGSNNAHTSWLDGNDATYTPSLSDLRTLIRGKLSRFNLSADNDLVEEAARISFELIREFKAKG